MHPDNSTRVANVAAATARPAMRGRAGPRQLAFSGSSRAPPGRASPGDRKALFHPPRVNRVAERVGRKAWRDSRLAANLAAAGGAGLTLGLASLLLPLGWFGTLV